MINGLEETLQIELECTLILCGDVELRCNVLRNFASPAPGLTLFRCTENSHKIVSTVQQFNSPILVATEQFIQQLPNGVVLRLADRRCYVLAILKSDTVETPSTAHMLRLGCRGVLPQQVSSTVFHQAVMKIVKGEFWAPLGILSQLLYDFIRSASLKTQLGLTPQEVRILELSLQGYTNAAIADALFISLETVRWHRRRLNRKLRQSGQSRYADSTVTPPLRAPAF